MSIKVESNGKSAIVGGKINQSQLEALSSISVQPNHILDHMDDLNEELNSVHTAEETRNVVKQKLPPKKKMKSRSHYKKVNTRKEEENKVSSLDQELEQFEEELEGNENESVGTEENDTFVGETMKDQIMHLLKETAGAPNENQIARLKMQHGDNGVHVMAFGKGDVYIYTHLRRGQWKKIQEIMIKVQETQNQDAEDALKEKVLQHCVLWPTNLPLEFFYNSRAGIVDSLYQVILLNSYFLSPQQAMLLTTQL
tara:strand:- start:5291 stop:6052 length:762 start_codon:yes stop_codon:yes gene_type:complete